MEAEMKNDKVVKLIFSALTAAAVCIATAMVSIPLPIGYANLGDAVILLGAGMLGPVFGAAAAGIGASLADLFAGFPQYIPATFIIKALMAVVFCLLVKAMSQKLNQTLSAAIAALCCELIMVAGYYLYESIVLSYGFGGALAGVTGNLLQGAVATVICTAFYRVCILLCERLSAKNKR